MRPAIRTLFILCICHFSLVAISADASAPRAISGVIDLRQQNFSHDAIIDLRGDWNFYWNELRAGSAVENKNPAALAAAPKSWNGTVVNGQTLGAEGFATYSLTVRLPNDAGALALSMLEQGTAVRIYIDGRLAGERGLVSTDALAGKPDTRPLLIGITGIGKEFRLDVQISNHHYRKGGMWSVIKLGSDSAIRAAMLRRQWLEVFAAGCLLIMVMYHLGVHFYFRHGHSSLLFSLFCFVLFVRLISTSARILPEYFPAIPFSVYSRLEYLSWFFSVPLGIHYVEEVFGNLRFKWLVWVGYVLAGLFALTLILPSRLYSHGVLASNAIFFLLLVWSLVDLALLLRKHSPGVRLFLFGASILALFTLNDILYNFEILRIAQMGPFGMVVFILCQAIVTSRRSMSVFVEKEKIKSELNDQLQELIRLRTRELANARVMSEISQQQLTNVINNIPGITYRCAPEYPWTMFFLSNEVEKLTGYPAADFLNDTVRTFASVIEPGDLETVIEQDMPGTPDRYRQSYRITTRNGGTVWIEDRGQRIYDETGELLWLDGVMIDITTLKEIETQLVDARDRAEAASQAKSQFLASMSHELRTPLHGILGMAEVLKDADLKQDEIELITIIEDSGHALLRRINDILDLAKVESGRLDLEEIPFDIRHLCADLIPILKAQARAKPVAINMVMPESLNASVLGDPTRLRQVLVNLLGNAVKFTEKGSITLEVTARPQENAIIPYVFRIIDTGIGIDAKHLEMIFEPFRQADQSTTRRFGGTGLGLSISLQIAEVMGGKISVNSQLGEGTVFTVEIPFRISA